MSTISVTNVKHESSASNNLVLDSSANTTVGGNLIAQAGSAATPSIQATGDTNTGIYFSAADTVDIATGGTQRAQLDSSGNLKFNSGYGSVATAYGVRAWINFDGTSGSIGTGRGSGNMDAVTDNGTGDYTVNFTNDMPDANYGVMHTAGVQGEQWGIHLRHSTVAPTVSAYRFSNVTPGDSLGDVSLICIAFVR